MAFFVTNKASFARLTTFFAALQPSFAVPKPSKEILMGCKEMYKRYKQLFKPFFASIADFTWVRCITRIPLDPAVNASLIAPSSPR